MKTYANQIAGLLALAVIVAGYLLAPETKIDRVEHALIALGSTTAGQMIYAALAALIVAVLRWALAKVPKSAAMLLVLCLAGSVSGCTPSQWSDFVHVAKPVGKFACDVARTLCVKGGDDIACAAIATACSVVDALPIEAAPTSGGEDEEPHDLDAEE